MPFKASMRASTTTAPPTPILPLPIVSVFRALVNTSSPLLVTTGSAGIQQARWTPASASAAAPIMASVPVARLAIPIVPSRPP